METAHLKALLRIAETGSISRAAESLGIAQPSLSQQLLRLEDEVGFALFERTARGVVLTEAGRVFRERARQLLNAAEQAVSDARQLQGEARGQVVLAMPPSLMRLAGVRLIEALAREAPLVRVRLVEAFHGAIRGWLESERIDLGVVYDLAPLRNLSLRPLAQDELVLAGPAGRFAVDAAADWAALAGEALVAPGVQHGLRQIADREAARAGIELQIAQEVDSLDLLLGLVDAGHGVAVVPGCALTGRLSAARIGTRALSIARNPAHVLSHASVRVEAALNDVLAALIAEGSWSARLA